MMDPRNRSYAHAYANGYVRQDLIESKGTQMSPYLNINNKLIVTDDEQIAVTFIDSAPPDVMVVLVRPADAIIYTKETGVQQYLSQEAARTVIDEHLKKFEYVVPVIPPQQNFDPNALNPLLP